MMKAQNVNPMFQVSEIQVSYSPKCKAGDRPKISQARDAYHVFMEYWDKGLINLQEQCFMLVLNKANRVIGIKEISCGGFGGTVVDPKIVFSIALKCAASAVIIAHNHPSENLKPSSCDIAITRKLVEAGKALDLPLLDHLIVTPDQFYSFGEEGLL